MQTIRRADHQRAGRLPDFGNFRISRADRNNPTARIESYHSYLGVREMMPLAKASASSRRCGTPRATAALDLDKMMKIVVDAGWRGYWASSTDGPALSSRAISELRAQLEATRTRLTKAGG